MTAVAPKGERRVSGYAAAGAAQTVSCGASGDQERRGEADVEELRAAADLDPYED